MKNLEEVHTVLDAYLWLSYKFEHQFIEFELCYMLRARVQELITAILLKKSQSPKFFKESVAGEENGDE